MQFSRKTDYALILVRALKPTYASGKFVSLRAVAERERLPFAFLEKLAGVLKRRGVLEARKGAEGGYRFARDPRATTLADIAAVFGEPPLLRCMCSARPEKHCAIAGRCPTRKTWLSVERRLKHIFENVTVAEL